jgi:hypothetical protein
MIGPFEQFLFDFIRSPTVYTVLYTTPKHNFPELIVQNIPERKHQKNYKKRKSQEEDEDTDAEIRIAKRHKLNT